MMREHNRVQVGFTMLALTVLMSLPVWERTIRRI